MTTIQCRGVLFDLDGVLADSTPAVARVWAIWAKKHGFDPEETVRRAHGRPSLATIRDLLPDADHAAENASVERMEIEDIGDVVALPGASELLRALSANKWTVVTSCTRTLALVRLRAAGLPIHPARFPYALPEFFIRFLTEPRQLVVDPFAGSNVTGAVADSLGRRWLSVDVDEEYLRGSAARFEKLQAVEPSLGQHDG